MKRLLIIVAVLTTGVAMEATSTWGAAKSHASATITIRHQARGCHSWSVNGNAYRAGQSLRLAPGGTVTFVNNDVMPHTLIQTSGPAAKFIGQAAMSHIGASLRIVFAKPGLYVFKTKAGEDYMKGIKTIGEDNVLRLAVTVR
jgi:plastocyanin